MVFGNAVPGESFDGVTHTGQRPSLAGLGLVNHILQVHTLQPVIHSPHLTGTIAGCGVIVRGKVGIAAGSQHGRKRAQRADIPVNALIGRQATGKIQVIVYVVRGIHIFIDIQVFLATRGNKKGGDGYNCN